jgi:hypothetical protein
MGNELEKERKIVIKERKNKEQGIEEDKNMI